MAHVNDTNGPARLAAQRALFVLLQMHRDKAGCQKPAFLIHSLVSSQPGTELNKTVAAYAKDLSKADKDAGEVSLHSC